MQPYYQDDAVTIYHGDAFEVAPQLEGVDLVLTDPDYSGENIGVREGSYGDEPKVKLPDLTYMRWCAQWWSMA